MKSKDRPTTAGFLRTLTDRELAKLARESKNYEKGISFPVKSKFGDLCSTITHIPKGYLRMAAGVEIVMKGAIDRFIRNNR